MDDIIKNSEDLTPDNSQESMSNDLVDSRVPQAESVANAGTPYTSLQQVGHSLDTIATKMGSDMLKSYGLFEDLTNPRGSVAGALAYHGAEQLQERSDYLEMTGQAHNESPVIKAAENLVPGLLPFFIGLGSESTLAKGTESGLNYLSKALAEKAGGSESTALGTAFTKGGTIGESKIALDEAPKLYEPEINSDVIDNVVDPGGAKSGAVSGMIRNFGEHGGAVGQVMATSDSISIDKNGKATYNIPDLVYGSAFNMAAFGAFEGLPPLYRTVFTKDSQVAKAGEKTKELLEDKQIEPSVDVHNDIGKPDTIREESQPVLNEKAESSQTEEELINNSFTEKQQKQIIKDAIKPNIKPNQVISDDIRVHDETAAELNNLMNNYYRGDQKRLISQALLSKNGILLNNQTISLNDAEAVARLTPTMRQVRTYWKESGKRKVLLTKHYNDLMKDNLVSNNVKSIEKELFKNQVYVNTGTKFNRDVSIFYKQLKPGNTDAKATAELYKLANEGDESARVLLALKKESELKKIDQNRMSIFNQIDDAINNHMKLEDAEQVLDDARNSNGIFGSSTYDIDDISNTMIDMIADGKDVEKGFYEEGEQSVYFTQAIKKLQAEPKLAYDYVSCLLGV